MRINKIKNLIKISIIGLMSIMAIFIFNYGCEFEEILPERKSEFVSLHSGLRIDTCIFISIDSFICIEEPDRCDSLEIITFPPITTPWDTNYTICWNDGLFEYVDTHVYRVRYITTIEQDTVITPPSSNFCECILYTSRTAGQCVASWTATIDTVSSNNCDGWWTVDNNDNYTFRVCNPI